MLGRDLDRRLGSSSRGIEVASEGVQHCGEAHGEGEAVGVREAVGRGRSQLRPSPRRGPGNRGTRAPMPNTAGTPCRRAPCRAGGGHGSSRPRPHRRSRCPRPALPSRRQTGRGRRALNLERAGPGHGGAVPPAPRRARPAARRDHGPAGVRRAGGSSATGPAAPETARPSGRAGRTAPRPGCRSVQPPELHSP